MSEEENTGETKNVEELTKIATTQLRAQYDAVLKVVEAKDAEIKDLKLALAKMKDHVESETKSKLIDDIRQFTNYGIEYLSALDIARLEQLLEDCKNMKLPRFHSSGDFGGVVKDPYEKLHTMFKFAKK